MKRTVWLLGAALAACGGPSSKPDDTTPPPSAGADTLATELGREVGGALPVAILPGSTGLVARSADGARERVLVDEAVPWALVDNHARVVWFGSADATSILLLDLDGATDAAPEVIVTGLPAETDAGVTVGGVRYGQAVYLPGGPILAHVVIDVPGAALVAEAGGLPDPAPFTAAVGAASFVGKDRVAALASRAGDVTPTRHEAAPRVAGLEDTPDCDDCGEAHAIAGTPYLRVLTASECGGICPHYRVYDPRRGEFLGEDWDDVTRASVAPDGSAFVRDGVIVRFDGGPLAGSGNGGIGGGWLGGGTPYFD